MIKCIEYVHSQNICHMDISLENTQYCSRINIIRSQNFTRNLHLEHHQTASMEDSTIALGQGEDPQVELVFVY